MSWQMLVKFREFNLPSRGGWKKGTRVAARRLLIAGLLGALGGCTSVASYFHHDDPPAVAAPADPFADVRPSTASVGVMMPDRSDFQHPWDITTYVMRVTQFGVAPPMNGGVAFAGDSETDSARWSEFFPEVRVRNFGISGDTTVGLKHRISQVVAAKPTKVFLQIGTNDVEFGRYTPAGIAANIGDCIDALRSGLPGVTVYVESLLPRQPQYDDKVRAVNALIKAEADKRGLVFIDIYTPFAKDGRLDPSLTPDDLHLSGQGYLIWRDIIRPYIANSAGEI